MTYREMRLADEAVLLLPEKALYWPARQMLVIADIHFGKAASFRAQGVPVPRGTTSDNLAALDALLAAHPTREIVFLGDFLHARAAHASATLATMLAWRARHPNLILTLVRGNHDKHAGDPAASLAIGMVDEPHTVGPFAFCHHPDIGAPGYVLAGHVHPVYRLSTRLDSLRLPCFLIGPTRMVLPSFGAFTGGFAVTPGPGEHVCVSSGEAVHCVR
ncbi:ligase-associated DNA damage response endonuclease PdeM [Massilia sp. CCM 8734]|uniref:ligase-associated DNA damage response endonuclease PdeM n=1 Tax=Massilia sp. CCM 8734 TaxID=2609283 RepID=UPI00142259EA|nr:ligase-associated DNA damage response endonuclease PdeM [Massilia sp. CCM 8734]NHZ97325.1 ligase-associated DNA damage response endonuclease PdeM [Massilia sp. CCM 8734]